MGTTNENNTANDNEKVLEAAHGTEQAADVNTGAANVTEKSGKTEVTGEQEESRKMESTGKEPEGRKDTIRQEYGFASDVKLKECKFCCVMIPKKAKICPNCKMSLKSRWLLKSIAAILTVAVIAAGSYYLSAYWGLIDDAAIPVWMARHRVAAPVMSVASMEPAGTGANLTVVEAVETEEEKQVFSGEEDRQEDGASTGEGNRETAGAVSGEGDREAAGASIGEGNRETTDTPSVEDNREAAGAVSGTEDQQAVRTALKEEEGQNAGTQAAADEAVDQQDIEAGTDLAKEEESGEAEADTDTERSDSGSDETDADMKNKTEKMDNEETVPEEKETELSKEIPETADEDEAAFRADCVQVDYKTLLRKQQDYVDTALMIEAQVVCQIDGGLFDDNTYYLCVTEEKSGIKRYYIIRDDRQADDTLILEGDTLTVYGRLFGDCKIPAKLIETRPTVPALSMLYYDLIED